MKPIDVSRPQPVPMDVRRHHATEGAHKPDEAVATSLPPRPRDAPVSATGLVLPASAARANPVPPQQPTWRGLPARTSVVLGAAVGALVIAAMGNGLSAAGLAPLQGVLAGLRPERAPAGYGLALGRKWDGFLAAYPALVDLFADAPPEDGGDKSKAAAATAGPMASHRREPQEWRILDLINPLHPDTLSSDGAYIYLPSTAFHPEFEDFVGRAVDDAIRASPNVRAACVTSIRDGVRQAVTQSVAQTPSQKEWDIWIFSPELHIEGFAECFASSLAFYVGSENIAGFGREIEVSMTRVKGPADAEANVFFTVLARAP